MTEETLNKRITVREFIENKLLFPGFLSELQKKAIEEMVEENNNLLSDEEISQDFKEIEIYLNDIYDYYIRHDGKDAGNLWIQFSDKLNAFKRKVIEGYKANSLHGVEDVPLNQTQVNYYEDKIDMLNRILSEKANELTELRNQFKSLPIVDDGWVSVKEGVPKNNDNVLIFANKTGEQIEVAFYNDSDKEWQGLNDFWLPYITHWRPLPNKPIK